MSEELNLLRRRFERERLARKQAESIAEMKSRELFVKSQELEKIAKAEQKSRHEVELLLRAFESFTSKLNINEIIDYLSHYVDSAISCDSITIYIRKEEGFQLVSRKDGIAENLTTGNMIPSSENLFQFKELKNPVVIENVQNDDSVQSFRFCDNTCSAMIIPLSFQLGIIGYLIVENRKEGGVFVDAEVRIAQALANEAAIALENARLFQEVEKLSTTDPLTGLNNRRYFNEAAQKLFNLSIRYKRSLSAFMLDIDYFKKVNDTYGHDIGDEVLRRVAQTCQRLMRVTDLSARYGGEEFCFLFPETNSRGAFIIAEKLRKAIAKMEIEVNGQTFSITASLGVSECDHKEDSLEQLIKRSDQALYEAKRKGRDRAVVWSHNI
jgi:diguanylate cyclase (GGDEF)-like protein